MGSIHIYFEENSELAEYEAISKGYRLDIYVETDNDVFNVKAYSMIRLKQDYDSEVESYGFYAVEPNLIIVNNTNKDEILSTINKLHKQKYFQEIKPIKNMDLSRLVKVQ